MAASGEKTMTAPRPIVTNIFFIEVLQNDWLRFYRSVHPQSGERA
jgi:hypothetical protein